MSCDFFIARCSCKTTCSCKHQEALSSFYEGTDIQSQIKSLSNTCKRPTDSTGASMCKSTALECCPGSIKPRHPEAQTYPLQQDVWHTISNGSVWSVLMHQPVAPCQMQPCRFLSICICRQNQTRYNNGKHASAAPLRTDPDDATKRRAPENPSPRCLYMKSGTGEGARRARPAKSSGLGSMHPKSVHQDARHCSEKPRQWSRMPNPCHMDVPDLSHRIVTGMMSPCFCQARTRSGSSLLENQH